VWQMRPARGNQMARRNSPVLVSETQTTGTSCMEDQRRDVARLLRHPAFEIGSALCVFMSLWLLVLEADETAPTRPDEPPLRPSLWIVIANKVFIALFLLEMALWLFADGRRYLDTQGIINCIVSVGDFLLDMSDVIFTSHVPGIAVFRCCRLFRMMRLVRLVKFFPELNYMLQGIFSALMTVLWGTVFILLIVFIWSLLAVQILHPINLDVEAQGIYDGCPRCSQAFSSVWNSVLTFSQTLIFGDSWGEPPAWLQLALSQLA